MKETFLNLYHWTYILNLYHLSTNIIALLTSHFVLSTILIVYTTWSTEVNLNYSGNFCNLGKMGSFWAINFQATPWRNPRNCSAKNHSAYIFYCARFVFSHFYCYCYFSCSSVYFHVGNYYFAYRYCLLVFLLS